MPDWSRRSIPARAGEPGYSSSMTHDMEGEVYPRACGGTKSHDDLRTRVSFGLSPRVRGNPETADSLRVLGKVYPRASRRSIPARAGEPRYIRPYWAPLRSIPARAGEDPPWSIPARAGEPD